MQTLEKYFIYVKGICNFSTEIYEDVVKRKSYHLERGVEDGDIKIVKQTFELLSEEEL